MTGLKLSYLVGIIFLLVLTLVVLVLAWERILGSEETTYLSPSPRDVRWHKNVEGAQELRQALWLSTDQDYVDVLLTTAVVRWAGTLQITPETGAIATVNSEGTTCPVSNDNRGVRPNEDLIVGYFTDDLDQGGDFTSQGTPGTDGVRETFNHGIDPLNPNRIVVTAMVQQFEAGGDEIPTVRVLFTLYDDEGAVVERIIYPNNRFISNIGIRADFPETAADERTNPHGIYGTRYRDEDPRRVYVTIAFDGADNTLGDGGHPEDNEAGENYPFDGTNTYDTDEDDTRDREYILDPARRYRVEAQAFIDGEGAPYTLTGAWANAFTFVPGNPTSVSIIPRAATTIRLYPNQAIVVATCVPQDVTGPRAFSVDLYGTDGGRIRRYANVPVIPAIDTTGGYARLEPNPNSAVWRPDTLDEHEFTLRTDQDYTDVHVFGRWIRWAGTTIYDPTFEQARTVDAIGMTCPEEDEPWLHDILPTGSGTNTGFTITEIENDPDGTPDSGDEYNTGHLEFRPQYYYPNHGNDVDKGQLTIIAALFDTHGDITADGRMLVAASTDHTDDGPYDAGDLIISELGSSSNYDLEEDTIYLLKVEAFLGDVEIDDPDFAFTPAARSARLIGIDPDEATIDSAWAYVIRVYPDEDIKLASCDFYSGEPLPPRDEPTFAIELHSPNDARLTSYYPLGWGTPLPTPTPTPTPNPFPIVYMTPTPNPPCTINPCLYAALSEDSTFVAADFSSGGTTATDATTGDGDWRKITIPDALDFNADAVGDPAHIGFALRANLVLNEITTIRREIDELNVREVFTPNLGEPQVNLLIEQGGRDQVFYLYVSEHLWDPELLGSDWELDH